MAAVEMVIMAGGQGTRFWPVSRKSLPKQFLSLSKSNNNESLIQATVRRLLPLSSSEKAYVVTNPTYANLVNEHLSNSSLILEPFPRNTAAAIGLAAIKLKAINPDTVMIVLPADHAISNEAELRVCIKNAIEVAKNENALVTIGIKPESPHTGYGYIQKGDSLGEQSFRIKRFYEKPNLERAKKYFQTEGFYWNSGMFVWSVSTILSEIEKYMPELYRGLLKIETAIDSEKEESVIEEVFQELDSISIDFGVLERSSECAVIAANPFGWNDIGSWDAWADSYDKDSQGNLSYGDVFSLNSEGCVVRSENKFTAIIGAKDMVVIDSGDALLVCPKSHVQDVKKVVEHLKEKGREELL